MKKLLFLFVAALCISFNSFSQGEIRAGAGLSYATEIGNIGLTLNGFYKITDQIEAGASFTHIFKKDYVTYNIIDLEGHYIFFQPQDNLNVYGIAGLSFTSVKVDIPSFGIWGGGGSASETYTGLNLGAGMNFKLTEILNLAPEIKYTIMEGDYLRIGATVQYIF